MIFFSRIRLLAALSLLGLALAGCSTSPPAPRVPATRAGAVLPLVPVGKDQPMISTLTTESGSRYRATLAYGNLYAHSYASLKDGKPANPTGRMQPALAVLYGKGDAVIIPLERDDEISSPTKDTSVARNTGRNMEILRSPGDQQSVLVFCENGRTLMSSCFRAASGYTEQKEPGKPAVRTEISKDMAFPLVAPTLAGTTRLAHFQIVANEGKRLEAAYVPPEVAAQRAAERKAAQERRDQEDRAAYRAEVEAVDRFIKQSPKGKTAYCSSSEEILARAGEPLNAIPLYCSDFPRRQSVRVREFLENGWSLVSETRQPLPTMTGNTAYVVSIIVRKN